MRNSKFSQSERLDGWDDDRRIRFLFGYEEMSNLKALADRSKRRLDLFRR